MKSVTMSELYEISNNVWTACERQSEERYMWNNSILVKLNKVNKVALCHTALEFVAG